MQVVITDKIKKVKTRPSRIKKNIFIRNCETKIHVNFELLEAVHLYFKMLQNCHIIVNIVFDQYRTCDSF